jgi:hypothetical protein
MAHPTNRNVFLQKLMALIEKRRPTPIRVIGRRVGDRHGGVAMVTQQAAVAMEVPRRVPHSKVTAAGGAGAASIVVVWLIQISFSVEVPAHVASAMTSLIAFMAGYLKNG